MSKLKDLVLIEEDASEKNQFRISREIIHKTWLFNNDTEFFWPPGVSDITAESMVQDRIHPDPKTWDSYKVRKILFSAGKVFLTGTVFAALIHQIFHCPTIIIATINYVPCIV